MLLLAIESSSRQGSLAIQEGSQLLGEAKLPPEQRSAQSMAPALNELLREIDRPASAFDEVAVVSGPGSFTGLRVGITTAKCFAYVAKTPIWAVNTLRLIAEQARRESNATDLIALLDAQRGEYFAARYAADSAGLKAHRTTQIVTAEELLRQLRDAPERTLLTGQGVRKLPPLSEIGREDLQIRLVEPTAVQLAHLVTSRQSTANDQDFVRTDDPFSLVPNYYRKSAAEEKAEKQLGS